jgi:hypothetical protein
MTMAAQVPKKQTLQKNVKVCDVPLIGNIFHWIFSFLSAASSANVCVDLRWVLLEDKLLSNLLYLYLENKCTHTHAHKEERLHVNTLI